MSEHKRKKLLVSLSNFNWPSSKSKKGTGDQQRPAPDPTYQRDTNTAQSTFRHSISTEATTSHKTPTKQRTFWERAYQEILNDQNRENQSLLKAYDLLLGQACKGQQDNKTQDPNGDISAVNDEFNTTSDSPDQSDESVDGKLRIGNEAFMRDVAITRLKEMQRKEWKIKWRGKKVFSVRKQVTRIVKIVEDFSGLIGNAAALDASHHAGLAWAGVCVILPLIINDTEEREKAIDGVEVMARITARYKTVDEDYTSGRIQKNPDFEDALVSLYRNITLFYMKAACYFARSTFSRTLRGTFTADAWTSARAAVDEADNQCHSFEISLGLSEALHKSEELLKGLDQMQSRDHIDRVKKWLLFDVDVESQHSGIREKLGSQYRESGKWLLDSPKFRSWLKGDKGQFWIQGAVGTGKTSLVSILIDHIKPQRENVAFFYFSDSPLDTLTESSLYLTKVLRAMIGQLALSSKDNRIAEEVVLRFNMAVTYGSLRNPVPLDREQAAGLLIELINSRDETTIILDGLDEFPSFAKLLSMLQDIRDNTKALKFLFSSQYVVPVDTYFPSTEKAVAGGKDTALDMKAFVEGELREFKLQRPGLVDENLSKDIVETLSEKAEGMFKWAQLCLRLVLDPDREDNTGEVEANWKSIKEKQFHWLIGELIQIYENLYQHSLPSGARDRTTKSESDAKRTLLWVFGALRPLKPGEYFMVQNCSNPSSQEYPKAEAQISKLCRNFIFLSEDGTVALSHSSVRDYLALKLSMRLNEFLDCAKGDGNVDEEQRAILDQTRKRSLQLAHREICTECLGIILEPKSWTSKEGSEGNPLLEYACSYWPRHASLCRAEEQWPDEILGQVKILFSSDTFKKWLSVFHNHQLTERTPDPLYYATILGFPEIVQFLLENGACATSGGGQHGYPLQSACHLGHVSIVSMMLARGAEINKPDSVYGTPLQAALAGNQRQVAMNLITEPDLDVNMRGGAFGNARQMALALDDYDLLDSIDARRSKHINGIRSGELWAETWKRILASIEDGTVPPPPAKFEFMQHNIGPQLLDWRLRLLSICVAAQSTSQNSTYGPDYLITGPYKSQRRNETLFDRKFTERMRKDDLDSIGFVPGRVVWLILPHLSPEQNPHMRHLVPFFINSIERHERFLETYQINWKNPAIARLIADIFTRLLYFLLEDIPDFKYDYLQNRPNKNSYDLLGKLVLDHARDRKFHSNNIQENGISFHMGSGKLNSNVYYTGEAADRDPRIKELKILDEEANRLEDEFIAAVKEEQVAVQLKDMRSDIGSIKEEISEMKREMKGLMGAIQQLIVSQGSLSTDTTESST